MGKSSLHALRSAPTRTGRPTFQKKMDSLSQAFSQFSKETARIEEAYARLQENFNAVNEKLEKTNELLRRKVVQVDLITHYLQNILRHMRQGIVVIGLDGIISTFNESAEKLIETKTQEALFHSFWEIFPDDLFGFSLKKALQNLSAPETSYVTFRNKELEVSVSFVDQGPKNYQGIIILFHDITEMRDLQRKSLLHDRMKELGEVAAFVAHEIRNPIGGIMGYASLLQRDLAGNTAAQQKAGCIIEGTKTLNRLVEKVLHYTRPLKLETAPVDLSQLLVELAEFVKIDPNFPNNVSLDLSLQETPLVAFIDQEMVRCALLNLLLNAFQAMPSGGAVSISLAFDQERAKIAISDNGEGMEKNTLNQIFSPFFTTKDQGNGFGLAEAYKIVQAHLGTIEVASEVGVGSTFTIYLPLRSGL